MKNATLTDLTKRLSAVEKQIAQLSKRLEANDTTVPAGKPAEDAWLKTLRHLQSVVTELQFMGYFRQTMLVRDEGYRLVVKAKSAVVVNAICRRFGDAVDKAMTAIGRPGTEVIFTADEPEADLP